MRAIYLLTLLAAQAANAQSEPDTAACRVITGPPDINERGELAVPAPTAEDCEKLTALIERFLATDPRDFRRVVNLEPIPGNVRVYIGRMAPWGRPWNNSGSIGSDLPSRRHIVTWLSEDIVVVVYETADFTGPATSVVIADRADLQVCSFPRWPFDEDPRSLSISDIQEALDSGRMADREIPVCHLDPLVIDDPLFGD